MMMNHQFSCVYDLTEDLVIEILMRLPVTAVIKMKKVCKSLYSLINSSDFIAKYSLLDGDRDPSTFLCIPFKGTRIVSVSHDDDDDDDDTSTTGVKRKRGFIHIGPTLTPPPQAQPKLFSVCCCCDGVLLVMFKGINNRRQLALWNPATGDIKDVPTYDHDRNLSDDDGEDDSFVSKYGCGFDSKNNEYRPFLVICHEYDSKTDIEIYSYKNKIWKFIQSSRIISYPGNMAYANGFCHWVGFNSIGRDVIVSFDIANEVILTTPFPDDILLTYSYRFPHYSDRHCPYPLLLNNDSLALLVNQHGHWNRNDDRTTSCFDIWVLGEYGNQHSWTKLFTLGPLHRIQHVLGFWNQTKIFLAQTDSLRNNNAQLFLYDTVTQQPLNCLQTITMDSKMYVCRLSLLPIAAHHGSKKTNIKKRVRVLAIEIIRNHKKKMKKKIKTKTSDGSGNYFIVVNDKRVFLADY